MMELTGRDRSFLLPLLLAACTATLVARSIEPRSIYDARLTDEEIAARQRLRESVSAPPAGVGEPKV
jgi:H+/Cl- antiporter ClcA